MFDESFAEAWRIRYGHEPGSDLPDLARFLGHRSIRRFKDEPVDESVIQGLVAAAQSAATSSSLQLYSLISVQDPARREAMAQLCADQKQIRTAGWFFGFFADHYRIRQIAEQVGEDASGLGFVEFYTMAVIDAALAAERMVCAAESLGLGICYIGALRNNPQGVRELLNLPEGVFGVFGLCLGWPREPVRSHIKPRLAQEDIWFRETYRREVDTSDYNSRMKEFYAAEGMASEDSWAKKSGKRLSQLTGREVLKSWLEAQGFLLK